MTAIMGPMGANQQSTIVFQQQRHPLDAVVAKDADCARRINQVCVGFASSADKAG